VKIIVCETFPNYGTCSVVKGWQNGVRQHYVTLPGSTASYGERTPTWQTDCWRALYTPENGFRSVTKRQGSLFLSFAQIFSALIVWINCQNGVPLKHGFVYCWLCHYGCGYNDDPHMVN